jgi:hypothetical protein
MKEVEGGKSGMGRGEKGRGGEVVYSKMEDRGKR